MKILIVDDDPNTVQLIEDAIPWASYGIDGVFSAYQGVMGLEVVKEQHPEIIISDIEMPQMDGMEFLENVAKEPYEDGITPDFIILTSHEDFSYYRKAIHYGVAEYLLKPFRVEELAAVISKAVSNIRKQWHDKQLEIRLKESQESFDRNQDFLVQSFLRGLLNKTVSGNAEELRQYAKARNISFCVDEKYYLVYAGTTIDASAKKNLDEDEFYFIFRNITSEIMNDRVNYPAMMEYTLRPYYILVLVISSQICSREELQKRCERLTATATQYLDITLSCLISGECEAEHFGDVRKQMDDFYLREGTLQARTIFLEEARRNREESESEEGAVDQQKITVLVKDRKKAELIIEVRELMRDLESRQKMDTPHMVAIQHDLIQVFYGYLYENHIQAYQVFQNHTYQKLSSEAPVSMINMIKFVNYLYDCTVQQIEQNRESETVIGKVKNYIDAHYTEKIGREEIAASVYLTPNYLSKIFQEETGSSLREYINQCRVTKAKDLMTTTDLSLTQIALNVGFENISYFSTVFKKYCGMTPVAWRKKM